VVFDEVTNGIGTVVDIEKRSRAPSKSKVRPSVIAPWRNVNRIGDVRSQPGQRCGDLAGERWIDRRHARVDQKLVGLREALVKGRGKGGSVERVRHAEPGALRFVAIGWPNPRRVVPIFWSPSDCS